MDEIIKKSLEIPFDGNMKIKAGNNQKYRISMKNDHLNRDGKIVKKQELISTVQRTILSIPKPFLAITNFLWESVEYTDKPGNKPMRWTFAEGLNFQHSLFCTQSHEKLKKILPDDTILSKSFPEAFGLPLLYQDLPRLPSVYLLMMQTFDVMGFETFASVICSNAHCFDNTGEQKQLDYLSNQKVEIGVGLYSDSSFFKNGKFLCRYIGYGLYRNKLCSAFEYSCNESKVRIEDNEISSGAMRGGHSYYSGLIYLDIDTGLPVMATMLESYVAVQKNKSADGITKIPIHVRRRVEMELILEDAQ
ncbi:hypothetical protein Cpap_1197 [Ruminiclostridium papyrosolvens DSM 2782]|uniref:Uncharacterized protein n=1 Tax=Ruminiclostridium papyrosolvens DSM 2782 TaxID=588581 RepID=F1TF64_9FIRM|nr:hypothetical protein [Ruminiclostridium papyrosolvens]EGD47002.1 hypothetical protein Cpap_1197 [Ruminiclostridium papyrosolvens DSM 2782]WES33749.1 hypothetical protein P0092_18570 [Ruminiclostridium papyrosolvens DSM 2782]